MLSERKRLFDAKDDTRPRAKYIKELRALKKKSGRIKFGKAERIVFPSRGKVANDRERINGRFVANPNKKVVVRKYSKRGRPRLENNTSNEALLQLINQSIPETGLTLSQEYLKLFTERTQKIIPIPPSISLPVFKPIDFSQPEVMLDPPACVIDLSNFLDEYSGQNLTSQSVPSRAVSASSDMCDHALPFSDCLSKQDDEDTLSQECDFLLDSPYNSSSDLISEEKNLNAKVSDSDSALPFNYAHAIGRFGLLPAQSKDKTPSLDSNPFQNLTFS